MQTFTQYLTNTSHPTDRIANRMPLPASMQDFARYVEQLLTPDEQQACNMATD